LLHTAVQEERQRAKERSENEVESTSGVNEDMPVEKVLEAELAVEPKTETYTETNLGMPSNSVSHYAVLCGSAEQEPLTHSLMYKHANILIRVCTCTCGCERS
jgi:retinoid X receptor alpha